MSLTHHKLALPEDAATETTLASLLAKTKGLGTNSQVTFTTAPSMIATSILSSNPNRISAKVINTSTHPMYLKEGSGASLSSTTTILFQYDFYIVNDTTVELTAMWDQKDITPNGGVSITTNMILFNELEKML